MMKEIFRRGPISCGIDANPLRTYTQGIVTKKGEMVDHVISVVGWGSDEANEKYWIVRNSWGEYWGELGYVRVKFGALLVEDQCAWAVPDTFTEVGFSGCLRRWHQLQSRANSWTQPTSTSSTTHTSFSFATISSRLCRQGRLLQRRECFQSSKGV